jgi:hypothetical protein
MQSTSQTTKLKSYLIMEKKVAEWLEGEIFEPLKDKEYFQKFFVDGWSISWPNVADISPETLYEESRII